MYQGVKHRIDPTDVVCLNGAVFKNDDFVTTNVLASIFADRKKFKKMMMNAKEEKKKLENELKKLLWS